MGAEGRGPKPYRQVQTSTTFLRVASMDWAAIARGSKTEYRALAGPNAAHWRVKAPCPIVVWTKRPAGYDSKLMVLERTWRETLIEMSKASMEAEGVEDFDAFRRYWMRRERRRFMPMSEVSVYKLRPWRDTDLQEMGVLMVERLYGDFL